MWEKIKENKDFQNENFKSFQEIEDKLIDFLFEYNWGSVVESDEILQFLENSPELKDKKFLEISYLSNKISFKTENNSWKKEKLVFNLETKKFEKELEKNISEIPKLLETSSLLLWAMEEIFLANKTWEIFWEIDEKDILKTDIFDKNWLNLKWKNLRDLQIIYRENQKKLDEIQSTFNSKQLKEFNKQQKKYLEFVAWIWDKYEWWSSFLLETKKNYIKIIDNIIKNSSLTEVFLYISELHQKIDSNDWQSTSVKKSYEMTMKLFSEWIFERLKKENASDKDFVNFSKILTWRGNYKNWKFEWKDIDDDLKNPELATKALHFVFTRKNWMLEKMWIKNLDKSLKNKNISEINKELEKELELAFWKKISAETFYSVLTWFETLNQEKWKKYEELDFDNQTKLWVINRLILSMKTKRLNWVKISENPEDKNSLPKIFEIISKNYLKESEKNIEKFFSSSNPFEKSFWSVKKAEDFWFDWIQKEAYELFVNMNWIWLSTFSDTSVSVWKEFWKIAWIIAISIWAAIMTSWTSLIAQWAVAWAAWSIASWWIYPKWYDSKKEAIIDLTSDVVLWAWTWALWWVATKWAIWKYWKEVLDDTWKVVIKNWQVVKTLGFKQDALLTWADVAILWFPPEFLRQHIVDKIFHNQNLIIESADDDLQKIYENKWIRINNSAIQK